MFELFIWFSYFFIIIFLNINFIWNHSKLFKKWFKDFIWNSLNIPSPDYENLYLAAIYVKDKGKGIGTDLMNKILDYCDEKGHKLYLHPFPLQYAKVKFNEKKVLQEFYKLRDWYKSFDMIEQEDGYMVYNPQ